MSCFVNPKGGDSAWNVIRSHDAAAGLRVIPSSRRLAHGCCLFCLYVLIQKFKMEDGNEQEEKNEQNCRIFVGDIFTLPCGMQ